MARPKKGDVNKSQAVRDELAANPTAKVKEIVAALAKKGIKVRENLVYALKAKGIVKKQKARRTAAVESGRASGMTNPAEAVIEVRTLANKLGGIKALKQLVDVLAE